MKRTILKPSNNGQNAAWNTYAVKVRKEKTMEFSTVSADLMPRVTRQGRESKYAALIDAVNNLQANQVVMFVAEGDSDVEREKHFVAVRQSINYAKKLGKLEKNITTRTNGEHIFVGPKNGNSK